MTIDDQIRALAPLTPGTVAAMAGYRFAQAISTRRSRGQTLTKEQLLAVADSLGRLKERAEAMAKGEGR
jgi:hypothetical protein